MLRPAPKVITHISLLRSGGWKTFSVLPIFEKLVFSKNVKKEFCSNCPLASFAHPLVQDELDENCHHLLCTVTVIKAGLISLDEILKDQGGCGRKPGDYERAKELLAKLKKVPTK